MPPEPSSGPKRASIRPRPETIEVLAHLLATSTGLVCVVGVFVLIGLDKLAPESGLPWVIATLSGLGLLRANGNGATKPKG